MQHFAALMMQVDDAKVAEQRLVVLTAADPMTLLYPPLVRWVEGHPLPKSWWVLSLAPRPHKRGLIRYPIGPVKATMRILPAMLPLVLDLEAQDRAAGSG
jgi:hypothetical protein